MTISNALLRIYHNHLILSYIKPQKQTLTPHLLELIFEEVRKDEYKLNGTYTNMNNLLKVGKRHLEDTNQNNRFDHTIDSINAVLLSPPAKNDIDSWDRYKRDIMANMPSVINNMSAKPSNVSKLFYELLKYEQEHFDYFLSKKRKRANPDHGRIYDNLIIRGEREILFDPTSDLLEEMKQEILSQLQRVQ